MVYTTAQLVSQFVIQHTSADKRSISRQHALPRLLEIATKHHTLRPYIYHKHYLDIYLASA